ncbi:hypothetical protein D8S82_14625 [Mycobacterium hodleri]|uniref:Uncharacterized protein n=1 Tax=Mycolicibacterium hodleri TaxID=49897 RepID=A0A544W0M9_9MYCO|nr:hypothetical protein [Mycolicibacterium hodleri]TQR85794.1 hypothetical protein D8S82_14625 [Mycolicibacterium hodleri]
MSEGPPAAPPPPPRGLRIADVATFGVLLLAQAAGVFALVISTVALPMSIDDCAYQTCGDEKWIGYAQWLVLGSMAPAGLFSGLGLIQLARSRVGSWLALIGVIGQWSLIFGAWALAARAGPLTG